MFNNRIGIGSSTAAASASGAVRASLRQGALGGPRPIRLCATARAIAGIGRFRLMPRDNLRAHGFTAPSGPILREWPIGPMAAAAAQARESRVSWGRTWDTSRLVDPMGIWYSCA